MSRLPVSLSTLEIFAEAGRLQSFSKAAESLSLTTSAVSQAIRKLEDRLSHKLFERTGNTVKLNALGTNLLREVEMGIEHMRVGLEAITQKSAGPLTMRSPPGLATLLTPVIQKLLDLEECDVRFVSDETQEHTSFHEFDITVFLGARAGQYPGAESLGVDVFTPVCRPDIASRVQDVQQLLQYPLLINETAAVSWDDWLKSNNIAGRGSKRIYFNRAAHIVSALLNGAGIGLESLRILSPQLQRGELAICPIENVVSLRRKLAFLYVTTDPAKKQRAARAAQLIRENCTTDEQGLLHSDHFSTWPS
ncbi:LysR family transcriptional regulator [Rhizobium sp. BK068]|uniref:LysR family transcriptional regulator n=1 Tax=Rhizobium sp. BK068 TaxID=2512130 RepID=UPI0010510A47|nr:LysR family transcriptional regulator [Rhizobium sp. BK068]TCM65732.1 DNA-binding transcriptional LysR family regulator [Rhizobium sp. BK068]